MNGLARVLLGGKARETAIIAQKLPCGAELRGAVEARLC